MTLTSPRFSSNKQLQNAANNTPPLKQGDRGNAVHLIQFAFIDLGYSLPISTAKIQLSPDGIFGNETLAKIKEFQKRNSLLDDGIVGKNTMQAFNRLLSNYKHRVRLHFRSIALQNVFFQTTLKSTQLVYAQYGIKIEFGSGQSLLLTPDQMNIFDKIDGECNWSITDGEYNQLHNLGNRCPPNEVLVYYVKKLHDALGCGGHAPKRPAVTVAAKASQWDTAHEVGHVLLGSGFRPVHSAHLGNLMHESASTYFQTPILTDKQIKQMRKHICCIPI